MPRFFKIYLFQLLKITLVALGAAAGLFLPIYAAQSSVLPQKLLEILLLLLPVVGFLASVAIAFLIEYWGRLTIRSFLGEAFLMLIALILVGVGVGLGVAAGVMGADSVVTSDGTGLAVLFFLFSGAVVGIIPGIILSALAVTLWKMRGGGQGNLS